MWGDSMVRSILRIRGRVFALNALQSDPLELQLGGFLRARRGKDQDCGCRTLRISLGEFPSELAASLLGVPSTIGVVQDTALGKGVWEDG